MQGSMFLVGTCIHIDVRDACSQNMLQHHGKTERTKLYVSCMIRSAPVCSTFCCVPIDPFGGDPFKGTDPFAADAFFKQPSADHFTSSDPFGGVPGSSEPSLFDSPPNGKAVLDPFGSQANDMSDADPFTSHVIHAGLDPFTASPPARELSMVSLGMS